MTRTVILIFLLVATAGAQSSLNLQNPSDGPLEPAPRLRASQSAAPLPSAPAPQRSVMPPQAPSVTPQRLSLKDAQASALRQNPRIAIARLLALASGQVVREQRSNLWPTISANLTAVDSLAGSRITAGTLNNPIIYERAAVGATASQLITDFGHTSNLVSSAHFAAKAENENAAATKEQILLAVTQAFYSALQAHAVLAVAQQTVNARQNVADQISALFQSKLKSEIDLAFANVNLAQAKLLLLDAQNNENSALANLSAVLGYGTPQHFTLVEDSAQSPPPASNVDALISDALASRPELHALEYQVQSAEKYQKAERDLLFPTISTLAAVGDTPVRAPALSSWYWAAGVNMAIPVFNGFRYPALSREAALREQADRERLTDLRNTISRDVRNSWLSANTAYERLSVAQQLLQQADLSLQLATSRYNLGITSIVELSQAQLQQTQAQISYAQAGYEYRLAVAMLQYQTTGL